VDSSRDAFVTLPPGGNLRDLLGFVIADISNQYFFPSGRTSEFPRNSQKICSTSVATVDHPSGDKGQVVFSDLGVRERG
jgi:hypothetical protein